MCTLLVAARTLRDFPLVVVANRDEQLGRASSPPRLWDEGFFAPRDDLAGGTWLGVNAHGVFVGITNRFLGPRDAERRSRGELVTRALALPSARAIHDAMRGVDPEAYNGFHLVYCDDHDVLATVSDGTTLAQLTFGAGIVVVTERSFGAGDDSGRLARIRAAWDRLDPPATIEPLTALLTEHDEREPLSATCIHVPGIDYGTRSAMVLARPAGQTGGAWDMLWADGPPCTTRFERLPVRVQVPGPAKTS